MNIKSMASPNKTRVQMQKGMTMEINLLYVTLLPHNLLSWHPGGDHVRQVGSLEKTKM